MIPGFFDPGGIPKVTADVWCPHPGARADVPFTVDTATPFTRVGAFDLDLAELPPDDIVLLDLIDPPVPAIQRRALIAFPRDGQLPYVVEHDVFIVNGGPGMSRLGRDILNRLLMVYDAPGESLVFQETN